MFYTIIESLSDVEGRHKVMAAVRYNPDKDEVMIIGSGRMFDYLETVLGQNSPSFGWMGRSNSKSPLRAALGNSSSYNHFEKGKGQEAFMEALDELEGAKTKTISLTEENEDDG